MNAQTGNFTSQTILSASDGLQGEIGFSFHGLKCRLSFDDLNLFEKLLQLLPPYHEISKFEKPGQIFKLITRAAGKINGLYLNDEQILQFRELDETVFEAIESKIQLSMAVALPPKRYFLHAGAVALNSIGIIIPGSSFSGKTTLTKEFLKAGAEYYSDDCAVIDNFGNLYPYSKTLSVRNNFQESEIVKAESVGAVTGRESVPVRLIVLTEYKKKYTWETRKMSEGEIVLELSKNLFYPASMTLYPSETFQALANIVNDSKILCGKRGEAAEVVKIVLADFRQILENKKSYDTDGAI
jgi:hypothetical protein